MLKKKKKLEIPSLEKLCRKQLSEPAWDRTLQTSPRRCTSDQHTHTPITFTFCPANAERPG